MCGATVCCLLLVSVPCCDPKKIACINGLYSINMIRRLRLSCLVLFVYSMVNMEALCETLQYLNLPFYIAETERLCHVSMQRESLTD